MRPFAVGTVIKGPDYARQIRELAPLGFECFQVFFWQTLGSVDPRELAPRVREAAEETGTAISSLGIYGNVLQGDTLAEETRRGFEVLVQEAARFGTDLVGGFAGRVPDRPIEESIPPWKALFSSLLERAEDHGVRLALENCRMGGTWKKGSWNIAIGPDAWKLIFDALPSERLGLEWEPCHQLLCLADPLAQLQTWAPRIFHVHGKDANVNWKVIREHGLFGTSEWYVQRTAGFGDSDWTAIMRILKDAGYRGTIDIEGWNDPVFKGEREMEGQVAGMNHLKACRKKVLGDS
ncbi:MAG TPA: sugar phosphate isomerase/epimerase family protein [Spirochaetia bacterium]|nr:sugar phosphate isomerase/epimerase family protein [Spirochaetia bacterium]